MLKEPLGIFSTLCATLLLMVLIPGTAYALGVGEQAPELDLHGQGQSVRILKQPGKIIYLDFWASWCGPCRQSFPWMNSIQEKYKTNNFQVIGINLDALPEDAEKFLGKVPAKGPSLN